MKVKLCSKQLSQRKAEENKLLDLHVSKLGEGTCELEKCELWSKVGIL